MNKIRPLEFIAYFVFLFGALLLFGYGWDHYREPLGVGAIIAVAVFVLLNVASWIGMRRRRGRRFGFGFGFYQPMGHPWEQMASDEARVRWLQVAGASGMKFETGWTCRTCPVEKFVAVSADGERCELVVRLPSVPWGVWVAGPIVAFSKDPRPEFMASESPTEFVVRL